MSRSPKTTQRAVDEDAELQRLAELACADDPPFTEEQRLILGPILRRWAERYPPPAATEGKATDSAES